MAAHRGGAAKNIVISAAAEAWARENGHEVLMDDLRRFIALYQASWQLRDTKRRTEKIIEAAERRIEEAKAALAEKERTLYNEALAKLNEVRADA